VSISDITSKRAKLFLPNAEVLVLKKTVFNGMFKLDEINKKARQILDKYKVKI
jgi:hypothetical protein